MALNSRTISKLYAKRRAMEEAAAMNKIIALPAYYEIYSGTIDYRSGKWIRLDPVDIIATLTSAREEVAWRRKHPKENQNACYLVRRYRHGRKVETSKND